MTKILNLYTNKKDEIDLVIFQDHIVSFNSYDYEFTRVELTNGKSLTLPISFLDFCTLIDPI